MSDCLSKKECLPENFYMELKKNPKTLLDKPSKYEANGHYQVDFRTLEMSNQTLSSSFILS